MRLKDILLLLEMRYRTVSYIVIDQSFYFPQYIVGEKQGLYSEKYGFL